MSGGHVRYCKGNALFNLGHFEEAIASYDQALKFKPDLHQAWNNRGNVLFNLGRFEEAIASYDQALKFKPDYHYAWYYKGSALMKLGRWREGNKSISKAFEINSDFMNALLDIQKKHIISWVQQKLGLQKLVWIWISILMLIGFRR